MAEPILVLWATPRSVSTAFEWMMRRRGDFVCLHEPFGLAYYTGIDRRTTRPDETDYDPNRSYASTLAEVLVARERGRVFSKDFANYILHLADGPFLDLFQHTFLVRDPAQALASMYTEWREFTMDEAGYEALHALFDRVVERSRAVPPVIDADDLLDDPAGTVAAYCAAVGVPFLAEALEWEPGERAEVTWFGGSWHDPLKASSGLARQARDHARIEDVPFLAEMHARCRPHYEALAAHRLAPAGSQRSSGGSSAM